MAEQAAEVLDTGNQEEPSMEEILASIRKIITEEDDPAPAEGEVIDLTEGELISPAEEPPAAKAAPSFETYETDDEAMASTMSPETPPTPEAIKAEPGAEPPAAIIVEAPVIVPNIAVEPEISFDEPEIVQETAPTEQKSELSQIDEDLLEEPALLSEKSAEVAGKAFHDLAQKINLLGNKENTLEGVVKELLRPMLKEWLDENLPRIVLKMVRKEIEKITQ